MHSKVEPASAEKVKLGLAELVVPEGPVSIEVVGAAVSIVQVRVAGLGSVLPAPSVARTEKVWEPSVSPV